MEFRNLTPFHALCFGALDPAGAEHRVVVMRVTYRLAPGAAPSPGPHLLAVIDGDSPPLVLADRYAGDEGCSSPLGESDLAPCKPRCDVIVNGHAYSPGGIPHHRWPVRLRLAIDAAPLAAPADPTGPPQVLLDKTLIVHGPRRFRRVFGLIADRWRLESAEPATRVPLAYELAFGGASRVQDPRTGELLLDEVCFTNPLGCGWQHKALWPLARRLGRAPPPTLPAPQWEYPEAPLEAMCVTEAPRGPLTPAQMLAAARAYPVTPAGLGPIGRAWTPRLQRAGTYDQDWLDARWPGLPDDLDFGYWNCAPDDQQIPYPPPGLEITLDNLAPPALAPGGQLVLRLPPHRPFVLVRLTSGVMLPLPMLTDTVAIDTDALTVALVHRTWIRAGTPVRVLEARFEIDPQAPLITRAGRHQDP